MNKKEIRRQKMARQQEILNLARTANRDLTDAEQTEFDSLQREIDTLTAEIEAEEAGQRDAQSAQDAVIAERQRINDINALCRDFGLERMASAFVANGNSMEQVREAVLKELKNTKAPMGTMADVRVGMTAEDKYRAAAADSLLLRSGIELSNEAEGAKELRGMSLRDLAIECLEKDGVANVRRMGANDVFETLSRQHYNPTSSFNAILDTAINKAYKEGHKQAVVTYDRWAKKGSLKDFKTHDNYYLSGPAGEFIEVPEGGEIKADKITDEKLPTRKLKTFARQFTMTRQAFVNDDIEFVTKIPAKYAASARKTINKQCYQVLVNNPAIYDGTQLFHANHKNVLTSGTGITQEALQKMVLALSTQYDQFGEAVIIRPAVIAVPVGYMFDMYTLLYSPTISTSGNTQATNPLYRYKDSLEVVEDPTINALCGGFGNTMPWFLIGAKEDTDFLEVDFLNGQEIPTIRRMEVPGTLGFVWDVYLDWGISVMDYRGAVKNPGVAINNPLN